MKMAHEDFGETSTWIMFLYMLGLALVAFFMFIYAVVK